MQAILLATAEHPKLRPLTEHLPEPLLPVANRPVMGYALELLQRAGCRDVLVSLHRVASAVESHFATGSRWGVHLTYILQREALGSAGALGWARSALCETFVVLPADSIVDLDIADALAYHRAHGCIATVIAHQPGATAPAHPILVDTAGEVQGLSPGSPRPGLQMLAATGVYIFEPQVLGLIPPGQAFDCYDQLLPKLLEARSVQAYPLAGYWNPLETLADYQEAQVAMLEAAALPAGQAGTAGGQLPRFPGVAGKQVARGITIGRNVVIHPAARLAPPVCIGEGCHVGRDAEIGPAAVIGPGVIIDEGATVRSSTVLERTYVGRFVDLEGRIVKRDLVIDIATGRSLPVVDPFLLGEASPQPLVSVLGRVASAAAAALLALLWLPALAAITLALLVSSVFAGMPGQILERRPRARWRRLAESQMEERQIYDLWYFRTRGNGGRYLPLGRRLELWHLDRLPSLWNVLRGDLRMVGVRPLAPAEADQLLDEWQRRSYESPAGFTGPWWVDAGPNAGFDELVIADAYYAATRDWREDIRLFLRTAAVAPSGE